MRLIKIIKIVVAIAIVIITTAIVSRLFEKYSPAKIPNGYLVFGMGPGLYKLDLRSCKTEKFYSVPIQYERLSVIQKIDRDRFLYWDLGLKNRLVIYNLNTRANADVKMEAGNIGEVFAPYYNPYYKKILFTYINKLYTGNLAETTIINTKEVNDKGALMWNDIGAIPVSTNEIIFNYEKSRDHIYLYDIVTGILKILPIKNCDFPQAWRFFSKQLLCYDSQNYKYFLINLLGKNIKVIHRTANFKPVLYLSEYDELLYIRNSGNIHYLDNGIDNLKIYDFKTNRTKMVCPNIFFNRSNGSVIYYNN